MSCGGSVSNVDCEDHVSYMSHLLNDPRNRRWSRELIQCAYDEAVSAVALYRPDLLVSVVEIDLEVGAVQTAPEGCSRVVNVIGMADEDGVVREQIETNNYDIAKWFTDVCCDGSDNVADTVTSYKVSNTKVDPANKSLIYVDPPVPPGFKGKLKVNCEGACGDPKDLCRLGTPVYEFVLYRLLSSEMDSASSVSAANGHLAAFGEMMGVNYNMLRQQMVENATATPTQSQS